MRNFLLFICFLGFSVPFALQAQQQSQQTGSLLPDINPQDIEIRGDFQARFVGLSRQPILGFNPRPRVFQIDPNRMPFIETADQIVATVSISDLERPITPEYDIIPIPVANHTFARLGFGMFTSPEADIQHESRLAPGRFLTADAYFHSSEGHHEEFPTSFRQSRVELDYLRYGNQSLFQIQSGFMSHFNHLGMDIRNISMDKNKTEAMGLFLKTSYQKKYNAFSRFEATLGYRLFALDHSLVSIPEATNYQEHLFEYDASRTLTGRKPETLWQIAVNGNAGLFSNATFFGENGEWTATKLRAMHQRRLHYALKARMFADATFVTHSNLDDSQFRIMPGLEVIYTGLDNTEIQFRSQLFTNDASVYAHHFKNPFTVATSSSVPEQGYELGVQINYDLTSNIRVYADSRYSWYYVFAGSTIVNQDVNDANAPLLPIFQNTALTDVSKWEHTGGISMNFVPNRFSVSLDATLRNMQFGDNSGISHITNEIVQLEGNPAFYDPLAISLSIFTNPIPNLYLTSWLDYRTAREGLHFQWDSDQPDATYRLFTNPEFETEDVFLLNIQLDYRVTPNFGLYLKGLNLLDQSYEYWRGYSERPLQMYGGITVTF